jgi:hypothetical protein
MRMKLIKARFLALPLVLAFLVVTVLSPVARADPIPPGWRALDWQLLPIATLFNYAVNLAIVLAAFWFVKRKMNIASMIKLAIIVLAVTLVGIAIWAVSLASRSGPLFVPLSTLIFVDAVEICILALWLRWSKLSTLRQGIWIGATMIIVGFFVGFPITIYMLT